MNKEHDRILLVDDDEQLCSILAEFLTGEGFAVDYVLDGNSAIAALAGDEVYHAMVLDIMMPQVSGFDVLKSVRQNHDTPVIMLTGRGDDIDRILGLEMGADDYLGKPCNPKELSARLRAVLRRTRHASTPLEATPLILFKRLSLDPGSLEVKIAGKTVDFTQAEFRVLQFFLHNIGQTLTKAALTEEVLQRKFSAHDRSIDVHISRIRQKLATYPDLENAIKSIRGIGYRWLSDTPSDDNSTLNNSELSP